MNKDKPIGFVVSIIFIVPLFIGFTSFMNPPKTTVLVGITNLRSSNGSIQLGIYKDNESFQHEKEYMLKRFPKDNMKGNALVIKLELPPGEYGIALLDDENDNSKMDYGLVLPKEGFGFSNYYHSGLSRPKFEKFSFKVGQSTTKVRVKIKYM